MDGVDAIHPPFLEASLRHQKLRTFAIEMIEVYIKRRAGPLLCEPGGARG